MKRTPLVRRTPLRTSKPMKRGYLNPRTRNAMKRRRRFERAYHSEAFVVWTKGQPCGVSGEYGTSADPIECAHVISRGAGGTWRDVLPLRKSLHRQLHTLGLRSFQHRHDVNLFVIARVHAGLWESRIGDIAEPTDSADAPGPGPQPEGDRPEQD